MDVFGRGCFGLMQGVSALFAFFVFLVAKIAKIRKVRKDSEIFFAYSSCFASFAFQDLLGNRKDREENAKFAKIRRFT